MTVTNDLARLANTANVLVGVISVNTTSITTMNVGGPFRITSSPFIENSTNVIVDYTISTNFNAFSAGPITINTGVTVTVPVGSTWTIS